MHTTPRTLAAIAGAALCTLLLGGCALFPVHTARDEARLAPSEVAGVTAVRIDNTAGNVSIEGDPAATEVSIEREFRYWGARRDIGDTFEVSGTELVLGGCGNRCSVEYTVEVPVGMNVSGSTDNGAIELSGVNDVDVSTSNGGIDLEEVTGQVRAQTSNGKIEGSELLGGGVVVETSNGAIELELGEPQDVQAITSNGAIRLRVPAGSFEVVANTDLGARNIEIENDPRGEFLLELETDNGAITVESTSSTQG